MSENPFTLIRDENSSIIVNTKQLYWGCKKICYSSGMHI